MVINEIPEIFCGKTYSDNFIFDGEQNKRVYNKMRNRTVNIMIKSRIVFGIPEKN